MSASLKVIKKKAVSGKAIAQYEDLVLAMKKGEIVGSIGIANWDAGHISWTISGSFSSNRELTISVLKDLVAQLESM